MRIYFAYDKATSDWVWNKEFTSPNAVQAWCAKKKEFESYICVDFELDLEVNRRVRSAIDHAVNRSHAAYQEELREKARLEGHAELQKAIELARKEGRNIARSHMSKEQIALFVHEISIKENAIKQLETRIEELEKARTPETSNLVDVKCEPIRREISLMQDRLAYIRAEVKEYQDAVNAKQQQAEKPNPTVAGSPQGGLAAQLAAAKEAVATKDATGNTQAAEQNK